MDVFKLIEKHGIELHGEIEYFAELIRQDEREACAKLLEDAAFKGTIISCTSAAKAIRARGEK